MSALELTIARGNRGLHRPIPFLSSKIECADGFTVSVIAGGGTYCHPRPAMCTGGAHAPQWDGGVQCNYPGPYTEVEVGFPSERPEPWSEWEKYADGSIGDATGAVVYAYVPVDMVRALIASHGGQA